MTHNPLNILVNMQGSQNRNYIINISEEEQEKFLIVHDCPDFKKGFEFCKHIVKTLLILDNETCEKICCKKHKIKFTSKISKIKQTRKTNFENKAEKLIEKGKFLEAISYYERAYGESKNHTYIEYILELAISKNITHKTIKYLAEFEQYLKSHQKSLPDLINDILFRKTNLSFPDFIDSLFYIGTILTNISLTSLRPILEQIRLEELHNPLYLFILTQKLYRKKFISLSFYKNYMKGKEFRTYKELKQIIYNKTIKALQNAILDMESKEIIEVYKKIIHQFNFNPSQDLKNVIDGYSKTVNRLYREALRHKHAALRSLLISNFDKDNFEELSFRYNYRYENLLWSNAKKNSSPLYYFMLEKCGFDRNNLNYINIDDFIENYPIFLNIFGANNPIPDLVEEFWNGDTFDIRNTVILNNRTMEKFNINISDIDKYILIEWDIAQKPISGSYICQFSQGYLIPEKNNPLTYEIKPFDLILCLKKPIEVKMNNIKIFRPLRRVSIENAIELTYEGMDFVSTYIPLNLVKLLKTHNIDEIEAINRMNKSFDEMFFPKKEEFRRIFKKFIETKITKEFNQFYLNLLKKADYKSKVLIIIGFHRYEKIFRNRAFLKNFKAQNLNRDSLQQLRYDLKKFVSQKLIKLIKSNRYEEIEISELKKFPEFHKWTAKVIYEHKKQLIQCEIRFTNDELIDVSALANNYYGKIILNEAKIKPIEKEGSDNNEVIYLIPKEDIEKINEIFSFLNLKDPIVLSKLSKK